MQSTLTNVRATYYATRRAYRIASSGKSLAGSVDAFRLSFALLDAGRALTGNWQPFERIAPRGDKWTECKPVYRDTPAGRSFVCYRPNTWRACTVFLKRCA